jgi:hypothetical protein
MKKGFMKFKKGDLVKFKAGVAKGSKSSLFTSIGYVTMVFKCGHIQVKLIGDKNTCRLGSSDMKKITQGEYMLRQLEN